MWGAYLFVCINMFGVHPNEAFSALRIQDYKNFVRLHLTKTGALEVYGLGIDKVPRKWKQNPNWSGGAGQRLARFLSRPERAITNMLP